MGDEYAKTELKGREYSRVRFLPSSSDSVSLRMRSPASLVFEESYFGGSAISCRSPAGSVIACYGRRSSACRMFDDKSSCAARPLLSAARQFTGSG